MSVCRGSARARACVCVCLSVCLSVSVCLCLCLCARLFILLYVCVYEWARDTKDGERGRHRDTEKEKSCERIRETETERQAGRRKPPCFFARESGASSLGCSHSEAASVSRRPDISPSVELYLSELRH